MREDAAALMLVLCVTLAGSVLSASFVVHLARWGPSRLSGEGGDYWIATVLSNSRVCRIRTASASLAFMLLIGNQSTQNQPRLPLFYRTRHRRQGARQRLQAPAAAGGGARHRLLGRQLHC